MTKVYELYKHDYLFEEEVLIGTYLLLSTATKEMSEQVLRSKSKKRLSDYLETKHILYPDGFNGQIKDNMIEAFNRYWWPEEEPYYVLRVKEIT